MKIIGLVLTSMIIAQIAARIIIKNGLRWGLADVPNERSSHDAIVPRGGGVGFPVIVFLTAVFLAPSLLSPVGISSFVAALAFINDRKEFSIGGRMAGEAVAAFTIAFLAAKSHPTGNNMVISIATISFAVLYMVGQANFFNFMDGINGLAAVEAIISFVFLAIFASIKGRPDVLIISLAAAAGAAGFLPVNFPRAKVFMGDVGSVFFGFLFGALIVYMASSAKELLLLPLFQGVFSADCVGTLVRRSLRGENLLSAHKQHLYQALVHIRGWTQTRTALVFGMAQILFGAAGLILYPGTFQAIVLLWILLFSIYWIASIAVRSKSN